MQLISNTIMVQISDFKQNWAVVLFEYLTTWLQPSVIYKSDHYFLEKCSVNDLKNLLIVESIIKFLIRLTIIISNFCFILLFVHYNCEYTDCNFDAVIDCTFLVDL